MNRTTAEHRANESRRMFDDVLGASDRLLWIGRPRQGIILTNRDWFLIPFSLLWTAAFFGVAWFLFSAKLWLFFVPFVFFVLMGLYVTIGRFFYTASHRAHTYYGITIDRAIAVTPSGVREAKLAEVEDVKVERFGSATCTINFIGPDAGFLEKRGSGDVDLTGFTEHFAPPRFALINDFDDVSNALSQTRLDISLLREQIREGR